MRLRLSKENAPQNERGQMAIFVALIFQILFIFFAMAINVGLVVHDKINLQNAVDLAAFYAAQRQAEMLNVIAHSNYQIHQSWKLLNWRYSVLGTLGTKSPVPHPSDPSANYAHEEKVWLPVADAPQICVTYAPNWLSMPAGSSDNPCQNANFSFRNIQPPTIFMPTLFTAIFSRAARSARDSIIRTCNSYSGYNWFFGASIFTAFLLDQQSRKELIRAVAKNLTRKPEEIIDLAGDTIFAGAKNTFIKNLTAPNQASGPEFEMFNSLEGLPTSKWLNEMDVWFKMYYQDLDGSPATCKSSQKSLFEKPDAGFAELLASLGESDDSKMQELMKYIQSSKSVPAGNSRRLSIGVEKNPWYLAYIGVKGKTKPRQLFFPFGAPIQFEARAYAQPFGGRVGPWYGKAWSREGSNSTGDRVAISPEKLLANGDVNMNNEKNLVPQNPRFPGDLLGSKSILAQVAQNDLRSIRVHMRDYFDITSGFSSTGVNDIVGFNDTPTSASNIRDYEIAAVAPDLFDIAYYSIQPNFGDRYLKNLINIKDKLGIPEIGYPRGDLGSRGHKEPEQLFSVLDQMELAKKKNKQSPEAYWVVDKREHLLTSWVHNDVYGDYTKFPDGRFGRCNENDDKYKIKAPGSCMDRGGRTGYSVKIISPEIFSTPLSLGGPGQAAGTILNPPPENW